MNKIATFALVAATGAAALTATAASAAPWMSVNDRQARLEQRIDRGVHNGSINRREAMSLRREFRDIARLENRYRQNGLSGWERADLDRRFDNLSARIRFERHDNQYGYGYGNDRYRR